MAPNVVLCTGRQYHHWNGSGKAYHETDEEVKRIRLEVGHQARAIPENEGNDEENHGLGERIQAVGPNCSAVRLAERLLERLAVLAQAVLLTGKRGDSANGSSGLASEMSRFFVSLLVGLVLEDNDTLGEGGSESVSE